MKIKRPYSTARQVLLVLGLLFLWVVSSLNTQPRNTDFLAIEEVEDYFEKDLEEEVHESFSTVSLHCPPSIFEVEAAYFTQLSRPLDTAAANRTASHPSGWMMPLRI